MNILAVNLIGSFNWYGFLIGAGMVICIIIAYIMSVKRGYYRDLVFDICIISIPLAIVGARLYYVIFDIIGNGNTWTFSEILGIGERGLSGLAIYGGLIGASIGAVIVHMIKRKKPQQDKATFLQMLDLGFTVIILGQIIGRWGNFANQEAYGNLITNEAWQWFPFAVHIPNGVDGTGWYQATFFYESFLNCFGFALLMWIYNGKRKSFDGFSFSVYCMYYGTVRFLIEGLRTDSLYIGPFRVSQLLSALLVLFGIGFIIAHYYRARSKGLKPFVMVNKYSLNSSYYGYDNCILAHPHVEQEKKPGFFSRMFGKVDETPDVDVDDAPDGKQKDTDSGIEPEEIEQLEELIDGVSFSDGEFDPNSEDYDADSGVSYEIDPDAENADDFDEENTDEDKFQTYDIKDLVKEKQGE